MQRHVRLTTNTSGLLRQRRIVSMSFVSYKIYAALKHQLAEAKMLYSEFCTFAPQQRYYDYDQVKKQMYKVHRVHLKSNYIQKVRAAATTDNDGKPDWVLYYVPGAKACAEYEKFTGERTGYVNKIIEVEEREGIPDSAPDHKATASEPVQLVQYFYKRFHGVAEYHTKSQSTHPGS